MLIMACFNKNFLFAAGTFTDTKGIRQFALGTTLLSLELLTVYLVMGKSLSCCFGQQSLSLMPFSSSSFPLALSKPPIYGICSEAESTYFTHASGSLATPGCSFTAVGAVVPSYLWFNFWCNTGNRVCSTTLFRPMCVRFYSDTFANTYAIEYIGPRFMLNLRKLFQHISKHSQRPGYVEQLNGLYSKPLSTTEQKLYAQGCPPFGDSTYIQCTLSMNDAGHDETLDNKWFHDILCESEFNYSMPDLQSVTDTDCEGSISELQSATDSNCNGSIPDLLSITDSDCEGSISELQSAIDSNCNSSIPDLLSITDSDCEGSILGSQFVTDRDYDSVPDLLSVTDSDNESLFTMDSDNSNGEGPALESVTDTDNAEYISKDEYINNWLPMSRPAVFESGHFMVGGGDNSVVISNPIAAASCLLTSIADADESGSDIPVYSFNRQAWIGCGKKWGNSMPKEVSKARNDARAIPDGVSFALIPSPLLSVTELLSRTKDPAHSSAETASYNYDLPNIFVGDPSGLIFQRDVHECRPHLIASLKHVTSLRTQFNDAWLSGARSIRLPGDSLARYPLWIEHFLGDLEVSLRKEDAWVKASDWLFSTASSALDSNTCDLVGDCFESFNEIPWDGVVPRLGRAVHLTTKDLASFLSDDWLNDEMINAGTDFISRQLGPDSCTRVVNVLFVDALRSIRSRNNVYTSSIPHQLDRLISDGNIDTLYIPIHVNGNHWALLRLDLATHQYAYSDSRNSSALVPQDVIDILMWWLNAVQHCESTTAFTLSSQPLEIPKQIDGFSCGIVVLSTIAFILLDYRPWIQQRYASERMEWFLRLSENIRSHNVSILISCR